MKKTRGKPGKQNKTTKGSRIAIYIDDEFKKEVYPKLKELARKELRSVNFIIKKAIKKFLVDKKLINPTKH